MTLPAIAATLNLKEYAHRWTLRDRIHSCCLDIELNHNYLLDNSDQKLVSHITQWIKQQQPPIKSDICLFIDLVRYYLLRRDTGFLPKLPQPFPTPPMDELTDKEHEWEERIVWRDQAPLADLPFTAYSGEDEYKVTRTHLDFPISQKLLNIRNYDQPSIFRVQYALSIPDNEMAKILRVPMSTFRKWKQGTYIMEINSAGLRDLQYILYDLIQSLSEVTNEMRIRLDTAKRNQKAKKTKRQFRARKTPATAITETPITEGAEEEQAP